MTGPDAVRRRGRPRSSECDEAILGAALRLLEEVGYVRMSMEGVATTAGVSKPTIYLRYASKAELVAAAMERLHIRTAPVPTGDLRADLVAQLSHVHGVLERVGMSLIGTCIAEERHVPDLIALLRARSLQPGRQLLRELLEGARERGEIAADADLETAIHMSIGVYYARRIAGEEFEPGWAERVVDAVLASVAPARADGRAAPLPG